MMRAQLDDVHARGEPLALLWASEDTIYGRFGYGMASQCAEVSIPKEHSAFARPLEREGTLRIVDAEEALDALPARVGRVCAGRTPGMLARTRNWWELRILFEPPGGGRRGRAQALRRARARRASGGVRDLPAQAEVGRTASRTLSSRSSRPSRSTVVRRPSSGATSSTSTGPRGSPPRCCRSITRSGGSSRHPRRMRPRIGDGLWVRLVDVGAALSARSYAADGAVVFDVDRRVLPVERRPLARGPRPGEADDRSRSASAAT